MREQMQVGSEKRISRGITNAIFFYFLAQKEATRRGRN